MSDQVDALQLQGSARHAALALFRQQLAAWGITMPPVEPLVLDFGLGAFDRVGLIECWLANEVAAGYCGKYIFLAGGQECPLHAHHTKHETFCAVRGRLRVLLDGRPHVLEEGQTLPVPPGEVHTFRGEDGPALILELSMPCNPRDNLFVDPRIQQWLRRALGNPS